MMGRSFAHSRSPTASLQSKPSRPQPGTGANAKVPITLIVDLPPPPSVNRVRRIDWANRKRASRWIEAADKLVIFQRSGTNNPLRNGKITGRFEATITLDGQRNLLDADNAIKSILDYAVRIELVTDDSPKFLRRLIVEWGYAPEGARLTLREIT